MGGTFVRTALTSLVLGLAANLAQSEGKTRPDLLTPLTDPTDDWRTRTTLTGQPITLYGQISPALLGYDDGLTRNAYGPVGNSNASTRIGLLWQLYPIWGLDVVARFEGGITPRASNAINQADSSGDGFSFDGTHIRKLELIFYDKRLGTLSLGQGSMATDGISEIDLSSTKVTAYSSVSQSAGGQFLRLTNGALSPLIIGDVFNNFDGSNVTGYSSDGSRALRVRYDTPKYRGMTLSFAIGNDYLDTTGETYADVALRYDGPFKNFRVSGGLGFSLDGNEETTSGSLSAVHHQTGANFTVALGHGSQSGSYTYFKIGMLRSIFQIGKTAFSLDLYNGSDLASRGSTSRSIGLAVSQQISSQNVEIFGLLRRYDYDDQANDYRASTAIFTGLRWKF